jgi:tripartite-type tricarboxylate transporter receptor subunit TctC
VIRRVSRRGLLRLVAGSAALPTLSHTASALDYPTRPVRILVGFPAGSGTDITSRLIGQYLSDQLGQSFITDDRPGAATNIATEMVVRAAPDGYTLLLVSLPNAVNASLYPNLTFDFLRDIAPVAAIDLVPNVMEVTPSLPVKTVPEFIAYCKGNPGKINMASNGPGSASHIAGELFKMMTGVDMVHVPYRGSFLPDLLDGRVQVVFSSIPTSISQIRDGKLRALAVTSTTPVDALPGVPPISAYVPGYEAVGWLGLGAPKGTPPDLLEVLNKGINGALADDKTKARLADLGGVPMPMKPGEFGTFLAGETDKWAKVVKFANIKPD